MIFAVVNTIKKDLAKLPEQMITASHNPFYLLFFKTIIFGLMRVFFSRVKILNHATETGKSLLIIGNHFSWWDGFFGLYAAHYVLGRKLFVMMLEEQLRTRRFLSKIGAFSIKKNSRSALNSFRYAAGLLSNPSNAVLIFPQGRFQSQWQLPLQFQNGWIRISKGSPFDHQMVFMVCLIDYFEQMRPSLTIYLKDYSPPENFENRDVESAYNAFYLDCLKHQNPKQ